MSLNQRQKNFCQEYIKSGNATQSAIQAGYSKRTANRIASENLTKPDIIEYIQTLNNDITKNNIAEAKEIQEVLTKIIRGQFIEQVPMSLNGEFYLAEKQVTPKDRLRACELLAKMIGAYNVNVNIKEVPIIIDDI